MKICVIGTRGFPNIQGGVETHCEKIYTRLMNDNITVFRRKPYISSDDKKYNHINFIDLPSTKLKGIEAFLHSLLSTIIAIYIRPDVIHYHNIGPALFSPLARCFSIPVVLTFHSANYEHEKWGKLGKTLLKFSEKIALKYSNKIIFVNKYQMEKYPLLIQKKSVYIPNGVDEPKKNIMNDFLDKYNLKKNKYILSVGRITPEKGYDVLIKAFNLVNMEEYKLVIAGGVDHEFKYMDSLKNLCKGGKVVFTGYTTEVDLAQLYANAALFVLASENEGFPMVVLEAASYNLDMVLSDIPAMHLIELERDNYFKKGDFKECAKLIEDKLNKPEEMQYDLSLYQWDTIVNKVNQLYLEICNVCFK